MNKKFWIAIGWSILLSFALVSTSVSCRQQDRKLQREKATENEIHSSPRFLFNIYGEESSENSKLDAPLGITVSKGKVFVASSVRGRVVAFDLDGRFLFSFYAEPTELSVEPSQRALMRPYPVGITVSDDEDIYVSDIRSKKVRVFKPEGTFLSLFPDSDEEKSALIKPLGLAYARSRLYVTDIGDQSIKVFNKRGKLLKKFGRAGQSNGRFLYPNGVAVGEDGKVFIADSNNSRIQAFDGDGKFLFSIAKSSDQKLRLPRALTFDRLGRLHVADTLAHQIYVFNKEGKFLFTYGGPRNRKEEPGDKDIAEQELDLPVGISIDKEIGRIYITDKGYNRVSVWEY